MTTGVLDLFMIYQFLKRLVLPFEKWDAFKTGVIDKEGNVLVKNGDRNFEQKNSWGYYDRLLANIKKLIMKVPGGKTKLATFAAALLLVKEDYEDPDDDKYLRERLEYYMGVVEELNEEVPPANVAGAGNIAGIGVGADGEPGVRKKRDKEIADLIRRATKIIGGTPDGRR